MSLFTDFASEMLYPIMPMYLSSLGYTAVFIGVLEGIAELVAGFSKGYFGYLSDRMGRRLPFIQLGYGLSALSKPMLAFFTQAPWIFAARSADRLGKGVRSGARDAMLADESRAEHRGSVFGFHRAMDTVGAFLGPIMAILFLQWEPGNFKQLFLFAAVPGVLAVLVTFLLKDRKRNNKEVAAFRLKDRFLFRRKASPAYRKITTALLVFALFNASDVFLLLKAREMGVGETEVLWMYVFYNAIFAILAWPLGKLSDKVGTFPMLIFGLILFALVYLGFGLLTSQPCWLWVLFAAYGVYAACTEGLSKALISKLCSAETRAAGFGSFAAFQSLAFFTCSSFTGWVWFTYGSSAALLLGTFGACCAVILLFRHRQHMG